MYIFQEDENLRGETLEFLAKLLTKVICHNFIISFWFYNPWMSFGAGIEPWNGLGMRMANPWICSVYALPSKIFLAKMLQGLL